MNNINFDDYRISVTNILGQEIYTSTKEVSTLISEKIDLSDFEKGVYILDVSNSNSTISEKIIVE
ncbi:MAG: T9SS type A sorting domain-containing protein [Flavobacteriales bacterium]